MSRTDCLRSLLNELIKLPKEATWVEFKENNYKPDEIGEYISALSNSAAIQGKVFSYMIWGISDATHEIVGTTFNPTTAKKGNEELENWLRRLISPSINFEFSEFSTAKGTVVILEIERASVSPVRFQGQEYIRIGSYKKHLKDYPEIEKHLWKAFENTPFENMIASEHISDTDVLMVLDYPAYFELLGIALPEDRNRILERLESDSMIIKCEAGGWNITNLGAILFAKKLSDFKHLARKSVRVILYNDVSKVFTQREQEGIRGYASGFEGLIGYIDNLLPRNEVIGKALRKEVPIYPELAVRELVADAIIHQDFSLRGTGPMIEIFSDRMEITNPGIPLVDTERFLDSPPKSRNEALASFLRRVGVCEERGSGFDKVVNETEVYQLPAPQVIVYPEHTKVVLYTHKELKVMEKEDRIRACYLHACLKYVNGQIMNNSSLRECFGINEKSSYISSRIIRETVDEGLIKQFNPDTAPRYMKYIPYWA